MFSKIKNWWKNRKLRKQEKKLSNSKIKQTTSNTNNPPSPYLKKERKRNDDIDFVESESTVDPTDLILINEIVNIEEVDRILDSEPDNYNYNYPNETTEDLSRNSLQGESIGSFDNDSSYRSSSYYSSSYSSESSYSDSSYDSSCDCDCDCDCGCDCGCD